MANVTLGDMAQSFALRRQNASLQAEVQRLSTETVTGLAADTGRAVAGDFTALSSITRSLSQLEAYRHSGTMAATLATGTQNALTVLGKAVEGLGARLVDPVQAGNAGTLAALTQGADQAFRSVVATLDTRLGGQSLFAGTAVEGQAMADAGAILSSLQAATEGLTSASRLAAAVDDWFESDFATVAYQGGAGRAPMAVGEGDHVNVLVTAEDPAIMETLKGLAMGVLLNRGALEGLAEERQAAATLSGETLLNADAARVSLVSRLGVAEGRLADIQTRDAAQAAALNLARTEMLSVDPYESAVRLEAAQTQVETLYSVTARLSKMSLADFI